MGEFHDVMNAMNAWEENTIPVYLDIYVVVFKGRFL